MKKIGVLISGGGTNLQALIDKQGEFVRRMKREYDRFWTPERDAAKDGSFSLPSYVEYSRD